MAQWLFGLLLLTSVGVSAVVPPHRPVPHAPVGHDQPVLPASVLPVVLVVPMGWDAIEQRVLRGVRRAVAFFRFSEADREEVVAMAMERAWRAFDSGPEPIRSPEAWGRTIGEHVCLDEVRRQRRDRLQLSFNIGSEDVELAGLSDSVALAGPFDLVAQAEREQIIRHRVQSWPPAERRLAQLIMDGGVDTITEAARLYRAEEAARGGSVTMYPAKAKNLLDARRRELEDLG